ncbi:MAG: DUF6580 family putative transport protein [Bacteroidota bacterium]
MKRLMIFAVLILAAAFSRLIPHPPNFTPLAAMALAGGVYLDKRFALLVPLLALLLTDAIIGFHNLMAFVYGSFLAIGLLGFWLRSHKKPVLVFGSALASSVLFFIVTNFGVWAMDGATLYPKTLAGLIECYTLAIPFFRNTLFGDVLYTGLLFGIFELVFRFVPTTEHAALNQPVDNKERE